MLLWLDLRKSCGSGSKVFEGNMQTYVPSDLSGLMRPSQMCRLNLPSFEKQPIPSQKLPLDLFAQSTLKRSEKYYLELTALWFIFEYQVSNLKLFHTQIKDGAAYFSFASMQIIYMKSLLLLLFFFIFTNLKKYLMVSVFFVI